jgi:hypothetical protein
MYGLFHCSVDASNTLCLARYANDRPYKMANAFVKKIITDQPRLLLFAKRQIFPGTEITYDYGDKAAPWRRKVTKVGAFHCFVSFLSFVSCIA